MKYTNEHILAENIDITKSKLNAKQNQILSSPISVLGQEQTTVEGALGAINNKERVLKQAEYDALSPAEKNNGTTYYIEDAAGGGEKEVVNGYLNPSDGKFYEESTYETEISSTEEVLYIDLNTEKIYRYSSADQEYILLSGGGESDEDIWEVMGKNGAKNLVNYPFTMTTKTTNGITFTDNGDGTVTANGTATDTAFFNFHSRLIKDINPLILENGSYILTGCPLNGSSSTYFLRAGVTKNSVHSLLGDEYGNGKNIEVNGDDYSQENAHVQVQIIIMSGQTVSDLVFKPMIRYTEDIDNTYAPYAKTNRELTVDKAEQSEVNDIVNVYGSKNILRFPYSYSTRTIAGITYTVNDDGTIVANGTATTASIFRCTVRKVDGGDGDFFIKNGKYILSGCTGGSAVSPYDYDLRFVITKNSEAVPLAINLNGDTPFTVDGDDFSQDGVNPTVQIIIRQGITVTNLVFKPMIRLASVKDSTYVPYAETNKQLTDRPRVYFGTESEFDALPNSEKKKYQYLDTPEYSESIVYEELEITTAANQYVSPFTHYGGATVQSEGKIISAYVIAPDTVSIPVVYTPSGSPKWVCLCAMKAATFTVRVGVLQEVSA